MSRRPSAIASRPVGPVVVPALVFVLLLAGCAAPEAPAEPTSAPAARDHSLGGAFTAERTQDDFDDFGATVAPYGGDVAILESFPEQFVVSRLTETGCQQLRPLLDAKEYLQSVSPCRSDAGPVGS